VKRRRSRTHARRRLNRAIDVEHDAGADRQDAFVAITFCNVTRLAHIAYPESGSSCIISWYRIGEAAMAQNTSISLGDHFQDFTATLVREGRFGSVSEAVRAGLRLLEEHENKLKALRQAVADGEASGYPDGSFDFAAFRRRMRETHGSDA
jgi:antitoxin ParD1/3/4